MEHFHPREGAEAEGGDQLLNRDVAGRDGTLEVGGERDRSTGVWQSLLRRIASRVRFVRVCDDPAGFGVRRWRERWSNYVRGKRRYATVTSALFVFASFSACNRNDQKPQLEHAQQVFVHGDLTA